MYLTQSDIDGSLAVCASLYLEAVTVGSGITELQDVIVAATLEGNGAVVRGNAVYSQSYSLENVTYENGGASSQGSPIDFPAADAVLESLCSNVLALPANGEVVFKETGLQLVGTDPISNVFEVGAESLMNGIAIGFSMPPRATAVVRVTGSGVTLSGLKVELGDVSPRMVLWSLCEAQNLILEGSVRGSVVAPHAYVDAVDAVVEGTLAVTSLNGTLTTQSAPFEGCVQGL